MSPKNTLSLKTVAASGAAVLSAFAFTAPAFAGSHSSGKSYEKPTQNIVETAQSVDSLSTLVAAVTAADLAGALSAEGPLTVFAPTNDAFDALPDGTVAMLLEPQNKAQLQTILSSHVVSGKFKAKKLMKAAKANGGTAELTTLSGATLTAVLDGDTLMVRDENGGVAAIGKADVWTSNGVVHVVSNVLLPADDGSNS